MKSKRQKFLNSICVIGGGYVGLPLALLAAENGQKVALCDNNLKKCAELKQGKTNLSEKYDRQLIKYLKNQSITILHIDEISNFTHDFRFIFICVPTPIDNLRNPNLSFIYDAARTAISVANERTLIVLESSTYPGTTRHIILPLIKEKFQKLSDSQILLAYSPERVDPGNKYWSTTNTPRLVSGINQKSKKLITRYYRSLNVPTITVDSIEIAEAAKMFENTFRLVNISLVNEFTDVVRKMEIDPLKVLEAANSKPFGIMHFRPSAGIGGHCIPVDPYYLTWWLANKGERLAIVEAAQGVNESMPKRIAERLIKEHRIQIKGSNIVIAGITYKPGIADVRETPARGIWNELKFRGANLRWWDPLISNWDGLEKYNHGEFRVDIVLIVTSIKLPPHLKIASKIIDLSK